MGVIANQMLIDFAAKIAAKISNRKAKAADNGKQSDNKPSVPEKPRSNGGKSR